MTGSATSYNLAVIRDLTASAFSAEDLLRFCRDREVFRPVLDRMGKDYSLADMIDVLLVYCEKHILFDELLDEIQKYSPAQYERFRPRLQSEPPPELKDADSPYDLAAIRGLMAHTFTCQKDVCSFCEERLAFRPVLPAIRATDDVARAIDELLAYSAAHALLGQLLDDIENAHPRLYKQNGPYLKTTQPAELPAYSLAAISQLLCTAFTPDDLRRFCFDRPTFRPVLDMFDPAMPLEAMVQDLLDYSRKQALVAVLLAEVKQLNPRQYARLEPTLYITGPEPVYLKRVEIQNIRSIQEMVWELSGKPAGWHVIIGDNGSGKSTALGAIALALLGERGAEALHEDWDKWLTRGQDRGHVKLDLTGAPAMSVGLVRLGGSVKLRQELDSYAGQDEWTSDTGFFSAAYGPFRRFTGGDEKSRELFRAYPRLGAHLSVFNESVALTEYRGWLQDLQFKSYEQAAGAELLEDIKRFVNQEGFLPHRMRLHSITSDGVQFIDGDDLVLPIETLSDGYRSILSMTFELIRQMARFYGAKSVFDESKPDRVVAPGIVLIDEIDAHLHPSWQRKVGLWFREHFPQVQFIVTTHSPLVCQAADVGTVYRLPEPDSDEEGRMLTGAELRRLIYGNVLDAYGTEAFGDVARSEEAQKRLERLAELNLKGIRRKLTAAEKKEQEQLRAEMPTSAYSLES